MNVRAEPRCYGSKMSSGSTKQPRFRLRAVGSRVMVWCIMPNYFAKRPSPRPSGGYERPEEWSERGAGRTRKPATAR